MNNPWRSFDIETPEKMVSQTASPLALAKRRIWGGHRHLAFGATAEPSPKTLQILCRPTRTPRQTITLVHPTNPRRMSKLERRRFPDIDRRIETSSVYRGSGFGRLARPDPSTLRSRTWPSRRRPAGACSRPLAVRKSSFGSDAGT